MSEDVIQHPVLQGKLHEKLHELVKENCTKEKDKKIYKMIIYWIFIAGIKKYRYYEMIK